MNTNMMFFTNLCVHVLWMKVASALEGLRCIPGLMINTLSNKIDDDDDDDQGLI